MRFKWMHLLELFVGAIFISFLCPMNAYADFTHVHTSACYTSHSFICYDHSSYGSYESGSTYCDNCGGWRGTHCYNTMDHCNRGFVPDSYSGTSEYCQGCGAEVSNSVSSLGGHWATEQVLSCGKTTETSEGKINLTLSESEWTNGNLSLSAAVEGEVELEENPYSFDGGNTRGASLEITENGTYEVIVYAKDGRTATESITVTSIDKTPPTVKIYKDTEDWSEGGVVLTVQCEDDASGIDGISFDNGRFGSADSYLVTSNGTHTVIVRDKAGNVTEASIDIRNVGRDPAVIATEERARAEAERARQEAERAKLEAEQAEMLAKKKRIEEESLPKNVGNLKETTVSKAVKDLPPNDTKDVSENDVSSGDVSSGDVSGTDISGNGLTRKVNTTPERSGPNNGSNTTVRKTPKPEVSESVADEANAGAMKVMKIVFGTCGGLLVAAGLLLIMSFSFVYKKENTRIVLLGVAKVKKEKDRLLVTIPEAIVSNNRKYRIFYSVFLRSFAASHPVYIMVDNGWPAKSLDNGNSFTVSEG